MKLTVQNVEDIFRDCLTESQSNAPTIIGEGVKMNVAFDPEKLHARKADIISMLSHCSKDFFVNGGGGMSFLNLCVDNEDNLWAGMHSNVDQLVCLGNAIGKVKFLMPRDMWPILPGGMPYIAIEP